MEFKELKRKEVLKAAERYAAAGALVNLPLKEQEANYNYRTPTTPIKTHTFATMQDVSDTAKATGKTTDQVIQDFKAKNIEVRTK